MAVGALESMSLGWQRDARTGSRLTRRVRQVSASGRSRTDSPVTLDGPGRSHDRARGTAVQLRAVAVDFAVGGPVPHRVLVDLTIDIRPGEFVAVIGASGSGKTTLLNLVSGLVPLSSGGISVFGQPPRAGRADVGYMFARDALLPWRTARQNVELGLELRRWRRRDRSERALHHLDRVGLSAAVDKYPGELSQGMRQRVALARTWATNPDLLLMDEPFASLDALTRTSVREGFLKIWDNELHRKTVLFVTHDLAEALVLADRVITIAHGRVQRDIPVPYGRPRNPRAIATRRDYQALYDLLQDDLRIEGV
jgi:NitT/TauT family transport system ATP-binding protein